MTSVRDRGSRFIHVTLPILLPGIIGVAMGAFTLSYDEYARTTLVIGDRNTVPLEIYALISSATSPTMFAIGTVTTAGSFLIIALTLWPMTDLSHSASPQPRNDRPQPTGRQRIIRSLSLLFGSSARTISTHGGRREYLAEVVHPVPGIFG